MDEIMALWRDALEGDLEQNRQHLAHLEEIALPLDMADPEVLDKWTQAWTSASTRPGFRTIRTTLRPGWAAVSRELLVSGGWLRWGPLTLEEDQRIVGGYP